MRRAPRARGVFSRIRPTASAVIRNHTCWLPSASSAAPNQRIRPLGSRVGSRGVRVWAPPGQSSRVPAMTIFGPAVSGMPPLPRPQIIDDKSPQSTAGPTEDATAAYFAEPHDRVVYPSAPRR